MSETATATPDQAPTEACTADALMAQNQQLKDENAQRLPHQLDFLQRLVFRQKPECHITPNPDQLTLGEIFDVPKDTPEPEKKRSPMKGIAVRLKARDHSISVNII